MRFQGRIVPLGHVRGTLEYPPGPPLSVVTPIVLAMINGYLATERPRATGERSSLLSTARVARRSRGTRCCCVLQATHCHSLCDCFRLPLSWTRGGVG